MTRKLCLLMVGTAIAAAVGCSSSDDETGQTALPADCKAIVDACHPVDVGTGAIHVCHETGNKGDGASCTSQKQSCVDMCHAAVMDAGNHDAMMGDGAMMDDGAM